jgi:hypothetical protein
MSVNQQEYWKWLQQKYKFGITDAQWMVRRMVRRIRKYFKEKRKQIDVR